MAVLADLGEQGRSPSSRLEKFDKKTIRKLPAHLYAEAGQGTRPLRRVSLPVLLSSALKGHYII
jgi:hypothetical protein